MKNVQRVVLVVSILAISLAAACGSAPNPETAPTPAVYIPRAATPDEETMLIRADSEIFAAVVRAQLHAGTDEYPFRIRELRYDPRPYGTRNGYPEMPAGVQGVAPELYFAKAGESAIDKIAENRKVILELNNVPEGARSTTRSAPVSRRRLRLPREAHLRSGQNRPTSTQVVRRNRKAISPSDCRCADNRKVSRTFPTPMVRGSISTAMCGRFSSMNTPLVPVDGGAFNTPGSSSEAAGIAASISRQRFRPR